MYKGIGREATESLIPENKQVELNKIYQYSVDEKILIIALPNLGKDTEFSFNYWISAYKEPEKIEWYEFAGTAGEDIFMVLCGICALLLICIICTCCYCCIINCKNAYIKRRNAKEANKKGKGE